MCSLSALLLWSCSVLLWSDSYNALFWRHLSAADTGIYNLDKNALKYTCNSRVCGCRYHTVVFARWTSWSKAPARLSLTPDSIIPASFRKRTKYNYNYTAKSKILSKSIKNENEFLIIAKEFTKYNDSTFHDVFKYICQKASKLQASYNGFFPKVVADICGVVLPAVTLTLHAT